MLFPSPSDDEPPPGGGPEAAAMDVRAPPTIVRLTPKAELVWEYRARFFGHPNGVVTNKEGSAIESQNTGTDGRIARDVEVVLQEASLQRRVDTERDGLATRVRLTHHQIFELSLLVNPVCCKSIWLNTSKR